MKLYTQEEYEALNENQFKHYPRSYMDVTNGEAEELKAMSGMPYDHRKFYDGRIMSDKERKKIAAEEEEHKKIMAKYHSQHDAKNGISTDRPNTEKENKALEKYKEHLSKVNDRHYQIAHSNLPSVGNDWKKAETIHKIKKIFGRESSDILDTAMTLVEAGEIESAKILLNNILD